MHSSWPDPIPHTQPSHRGLGNCSIVITAMCRSCCLALGRSTLLLLDVVDACGGAFCLGYGAWLHHTLAKGDADERHKLAWSVVLVVVLGCCLCLTSLLSLVAVTFGEQFGCLLLLSGFTGLGLGVFELCLLIAFGALKESSLDFLDTHKESFGLTQSGVETFRSMYVVTLWLLAGLVVAEIVRFRLSGGCVNWSVGRWAGLASTCCVPGVWRRYGARSPAHKMQRTQQTGHLRRELALDWREARSYREQLLQEEASEAGRRR